MLTYGAWSWRLTHCDVGPAFSPTFDLIVRIDHFHHLMCATQIMGGHVAYEGSPLGGGTLFWGLRARLRIFSFAGTSVSTSMAWDISLAVIKAFLGALLVVCGRGAIALSLHVFYSTAEITRRGVRPSI